MTTTTPAPTAAPGATGPGTSAARPLRLIHSELLKIRTTNGWWLFALGALVMLAWAFLVNAVEAHLLLQGADDVARGAPPGQAAQVQAQADVVYQVANLYTSGQFFGLLFVMLLGSLMMTNEFHHQTVTTTFLTTPRRTAVVAAKLVTSALFGAGIWLVTTALTVPATMIFLGTEGLSSHFGDWEVTRAILLNLLAYVLWGVFGIGLGVLIRSQIAATVTAVVLYLIGTKAAQVVFMLLSDWFHADWLQKWQVIVPSIASQLMISGTKLPGSPPQWVGAVVLIGYAVLTGIAGTMIVRRRDIS